jgi:hypothetical protein
VKFTDAGPDLLPGKNGLEQSPPAHLWIALAVQAVMILCIVQLVGIRAWDDGAITLAYSRTFAETGRIALTSVSETVEGYSSRERFTLPRWLQAFFSRTAEPAVC